MPEAELGSLFAETIKFYFSVRCGTDRSSDRSQPIERVISQINPVLRGWVNPVSHHSHLPHPPGYLPA
jgi:Group II intron, maturase-specific domain